MLNDNDFGFYKETRKANAKEERVVTASDLENDLKNLKLVILNRTTTFYSLGNSLCNYLIPYIMRSILFFFLSVVALSDTFCQKPQIGVAEFMENDSVITASGFSVNLESIVRLVSPLSVSDAQFDKNKLLFSQLKTPIYAFNIFIPGELKVVGPDVDEEALYAYVEKTMHRISQTNTKVVVWGSGGSRRLPDGWDKKTAFQQIIRAGKKIAAIAEKYGITVALENLNSSETNFITSVAEALYVVKKVNHPHLKLGIDIYHMLKDKEDPAIMYKTKKYAYHVEIAESEGRKAPGVGGTDFRPYLLPLAKIGYHNPIVIEGRWDDLSTVGKMTVRFLQQQIDAVYP